MTVVRSSAGNGLLSLFTSVFSVESLGAFLLTPAYPIEKENRQLTVFYRETSITIMGIMATMLKHAQTRENNT